jgi:hypothetical protein
MSDGFERVVREESETNERLREAWRQLAEALQARVDELEFGLSAETVFADVLRLPGVRSWLLSRFHPDQHRNANEAQRRVLIKILGKVSAAYELIERRRAGVA